MSGTRRWQPWFSLAFYIVGHVKMLLRGCPKTNLAFLLPLALAVADVVMERRGTPLRYRSAANLARQTYDFAAMWAMVLLSCKYADRLGPDCTSGPCHLGFAMLLTLAKLCVTPCLMEHLDALCLITGLVSSNVLYLQYLQRNGGLGMMGQFDPSGEVAAAITSGVVLVCAAYYALRCWMASASMVAFLQSFRESSGTAGSVPSPHQLGSLRRVLRLAMDGPSFGRRWASGPMGFFSMAAAVFATGALALHNIRLGLGSAAVVAAVWYRLYWVHPEVGISFATWTIIIPLPIVEAVWWPPKGCLQR